MSSSVPIRNTGVVPPPYDLAEVSAAVAVPFDGTVYNFQTGEDESYVAVESSSTTASYKPSATTW